MDSNIALKNKIHTIRGVQVMLDSDLAQLYAVETKQINRAVKRNKNRFPNKFMFQLKDDELNILNLRCQFDTSSQKHGGRRYLPYVFTEQGVSMLSAVLKSETAVEVSIQIINAFVMMKKFISKNAELFIRLESIETNQLKYEIKTQSKFEKIFKALQTEKPKQGIFYNGEIFDAYIFVSQLIRDVEKSVILIDNYIDETVLTLFSKRKKNVSVIIYTKKISKQLQLDVNKFNKQYPPIQIKEFNNSHDRFIIIDSKKIYHFGASLKDLGTKWFAFSKFENEAIQMIKKYNKKVSEHLYTS